MRSINRVQILGHVGKVIPLQKVTKIDVATNRYWKDESGENQTTTDWCTLTVLDEKTIGFADFTGNRQYVSVGNLMNDDRVSLFFMDYPNRTRLKLLGRVKLVAVSDGVTIARLAVPDYRARIERAFVISVEAFDWNCPQHITPRFTLEQIEASTAPSATYTTRRCSCSREVSMRLVPPQPVPGSATLK